MLGDHSSSKSSGGGAAARGRAPRQTLASPPSLSVAGLGTEPERLKWFAEAEKTNGRWAMAAVAGILFTELLGKTKCVLWLRAGGAWGACTVALAEAALPPSAAVGRRARPRAARRSSRPAHPPLTPPIHLPTVAQVV